MSLLRCGQFSILDSVKNVPPTRQTVVFTRAPIQLILWNFFSGVYLPKREAGHSSQSSMYKVKNARSFHLHPSHTLTETAGLRLWMVRNTNRKNIESLVSTFLYHMNDLIIFLFEKLIVTQQFKEFTCFHRTHKLHYRVQKNQALKPCHVHQESGELFLLNTF